MRKQTVIDVISALLVLLFLYAATSKLIDLDKFLAELKNQPFSNWMAPYMAAGILGAEIMVSVLLFMPKSRLAGLWASFILMVLFTGYIALILTNYYGRIPCSCGGIISKLNWTKHLFFNLFFVVITLFGILLMRKPKQKDSLQKHAFA